MRTLTIMKNKPESKERNDICKAALRATIQTIRITAGKDRRSHPVTPIWDVRQH